MNKNNYKEEVIGERIFIYIFPFGTIEEYEALRNFVRSMAKLKFIEELEGPGATVCRFRINQECNQLLDIVWSDMRGITVQQEISHSREILNEVVSDINNWVSSKEC